MAVTLLSLSLFGTPNLFGQFIEDLSDGRQHSGWVVTECQAKFSDGTVLLEGGDGFVRTPFDYEDFEFEFEWKPLAEAKWDSGIYFRSELPADGQHWPKRYQINLLEGHEGDLIGNPNAKGGALKSPRDWNHFKLRVVGPKATLWLNGEQRWEVDNIEPTRGYIGFQSEVPLGGQFLFRKVKVTELNHKSLFDGASLTGWEYAGNTANECWEVRDRLLVCNGKKGDWLRLSEPVKDFNLRLEYQVKSGGNSGVYVRVPKDGNHHGPGAGLEVQILDDSAPQYASLKDYQYSAGLYDVRGVAKKVSRAPGEWNALEIEAKGGVYRITHNGVVVIETNMERDPILKERLLEGFLGLQNHSEEVCFRNLRLQRFAN